MITFEKVLRLWRCVQLHVCAVWSNVSSSVACCVNELVIFC